ncbi:MAG: DNA translocase FtsK [Anaerolineae bacterium]
MARAGAPAVVAEAADGADGAGGDGAGGAGAAAAPDRRVSDAGVDRHGPAPDVAPYPGMARATSKPDWVLPRIPDIFDEVAEGGGAMPDDAEAQARTIEQTLGDFGIPVKVVQINRGPRITQFGLEPGVIERKGERIRVKVSRIVALQNDLALALAAAPIRVQAPVPGRPYVGIEVPNKAEDVVSLRSIIESDAFKKVADKGALPIGLGRDISGKPVAADLAKMPHLLIAGATGAGKSVAINTLICSLLMTHTPETLKLVLVDPKRVELVGYRGLPHLAAPVVVEVERVVGVLQWAVREMERRYKAFAEAGARNIETWNQMEAAAGRATLPYLVIVIDELADLMMVAPEEAERLITRLAQLARATGMHLVLATQRPSVDVVTGLIKANFPARIAFAVSSSIDSRVILDSVGADKLLGRGDMLYMAADSSKLQRIQGCYLSDAEIERLGHHWKYAARPTAAPGEAQPDMTMTLGIPDPLIQPDLWDAMLDAGADRTEAAGARDELWHEAVALIAQHRTASTSFLQRKLRIGYSRAARLLDELEAAGHVGPAHGSAGREVHVVAEGDGEARGGAGAAAGARDGEDGADDRGWRIE